VVVPPRACAGERDFQQRWIGKTSDGHGKPCTAFLGYLRYNLHQSQTSCPQKISRRLLRSMSFALGFLSETSA
jgi:hypothetical protein